MLVPLAILYSLSVKILRLQIIPIGFDKIIVYFLFWYNTALMDYYIIKAS